MPLDVGWGDILLRLSLALLAGAALGFNRTERGMTAGLRTTLLVTLAAAVSMIQANLLLVTHGKSPDSFVVLDMMRLPLGVLTGMGFIGAGAILRKGDRVTGVTTAATLWLATNLGLAFGGGQHALGLAGLLLGLVILWLLKRVEAGIAQEQKGTLTLRVRASGPEDAEIEGIIHQAGARTKAWSVAYLGRDPDRLKQVRCEVRWSGRPNDPLTPKFVSQLADRPDVVSVRWRNG
jgi:putative Mg2+ transporter-C (MgtC) family protein